MSDAAANSTRPVALVTGASAGLGREFATQLARRGFDLILVSRDAARLQTLANELDSLGASSEIIPADLTQDEDVSVVVARIDRSVPDVLVNNAGFGTRRSLARESRELQEAMIRVHVMAANRLAHAAVQGMVDRNSGSIINVCSIASWMTSPGNVNYSATKAWQRSFIESLSLELRGTGVYVQALCPGYVHTEFHARGAMDMSHTPSWMWMNPDVVVAESLAAMERRSPVVVVPGSGYKLVALVLRFMPRWCWRLIVGTVGRSRRAGRPGQ